MTDLFGLQGHLSVDTTVLENLPGMVRDTAGKLRMQSQLTIDGRQAAGQLQHVQRTQQDLTRRIETPARFKIDTTWFDQRIEAQKKNLDSLQTKLDGLGTHGGGAGGGLSLGGAGGKALASQAFLAGASIVGAIGVRRLAGEAIGAAGIEQRMNAGIERGFGAQGAGINQALTEMSERTAYAKVDLQRAAVVLSDVGEAGNLTASQLEALTKVATGLAATSVRPEFMDNVAGAADGLGRALTGIDRGLRLEGIQTNDTYMKTVAFNGALKSTWDKLTDAEKMQQRYNALIAQTADLANAAATDQDQYGRSLRETKLEIANASSALGEKLLPVVKTVLDLLNRLPTGVVQGGMVGAGALATAATLAGPAMMLGGVGKKLLGAGGKSVGQEIVESAAQGVSEEIAEAAAKGAGRLIRRKGVGRAIGEVASQELDGVLQEAGTTILEKVGKRSGWLTKLAGGIPGVSAVGGGGVLAAGALGVAVAGPLALGAKIATDVEAEKEQRNTAQGYAELQLQRLRLYQRQLTEGKDYGIYLDDANRLQQGKAGYFTGKPGEANFGIAAKFWAEAGGANTANRSLAEEIATYGQVGKPGASGLPAPTSPVQVVVQIVNQTGGPIAAMPAVTNAGSYAPSSS